MKVVGLDLSQTGSGIAIHEPGGLTYVREVGEKGHAGATLYERHERMERAVKAIVRECGDADLVVVEAHDFFGKFSANMHDRAGMWWRVVSELIERGVGVAQAPPKVLKAYLANNGNASKDLMLATAVRRYTTVNIESNNQADAMAALSMGVRHLELAPLETVWNAKMEQAMSKVEWP